MSDAGRQKFEEIELIEFDPSAFGGTSVADDSSHAGAMAGNPTALRPAALQPSTVPGVTMVVTALLVGAALVVSALAANLSSDRPGRVLTFPPLQRQLPTLEGHVVFDPAPGDLTTAGLGTPGSDGRAAAFRPGDLIGYGFAAPGAHLALNGETSGPVATFWSAPADGTNDPGPITNPDTLVQGAPATVDTVDTQTVITFGPVDGRVFVLTTYDLDREDGLRLAEVVAVRDGVPAITDDRALGGMSPVGSLAEYRAAYDAVLNAGDFGALTENLVFVQYDDGGDTYTLASIPAPHETMLPILHFMFPSGNERTVRGTTALVMGHDGAAFPGVITGALVAWVEGGRLIVVTGPGDEEATLALAESVRTATDDEWADIADVADRTSNPLSRSIAPAVVLDSGTERDGGTYTLTATWQGESQFEACVETAEGVVCGPLMGGPLPLLFPLQQGRSTFLVAVADPAADQAFLVLTFADPTVAPQVHPLVHHDNLPGPTVGVRLPDSVVAAELTVDGTVVATWTLNRAG